MSIRAHYNIPGLHHTKLRVSVRETLGTPSNALSEDQPSRHHIFVSRKIVFPSNLSVWEMLFLFHNKRDLLA